MKFENKGFSLIEILLVLSIIMILMISGLFVYKKVIFHNKSNESIKEINSISFQVLDIAYNSGFDTVAYSSSEFPFDLVNTGLLQIENEHNVGYIRSYKSPMGGAMVVQIYYKSGGSQAIFSGVNFNFEMHDFDTNSCVKIANSQVMRNDLNDITINSNYIYRKEDGETKDVKKIKSEILKYCDDKKEDNNRNIKFTFA